MLNALYTATVLAAAAWLAYEFVSGFTAHLNRPDATTEAVTVEPQPETPAPSLDSCPFPATVVEKPAPVPQSVGAMALDLNALGIRELRIIARDRGIKGAARLNKAQALAALS